MSTTSASSLRALLSAIPKVDADVIDAATAALMRAVDEYMANFSLVDGHGRRSKSGIAEARVSVAALHKSLLSVRAQLSDLPLNAFAELTNAYNAPMGRLKDNVEQVFQATDSALKSLQSQPNKTPNYHRHVLAYDVAVVFRDILHVKPSATRDNATNVTKSRGGAAYATVLRATLAAAGVSQVKLGPLIDIGLKMLSDPDLPQNLQ